MCTDGFTHSQTLEHYNQAMHMARMMCMITNGPQQWASVPEMMLLTRLLLTQVREMLLYTSELERPVTETRADKEAVVDEYISKLRLDNCKANPCILFFFF
jgi:hypothetical protein